MTAPGRRRTTVVPGRRGTLRTYRDVIGLTGPWLAVLSFLGRLPTATMRFGSVLLVARTSGSLAAAGLTGGALALGQVACGPLVGRLADRHGRRTVVLVLSLADATAIAALVAGALAGAGAPLLAAPGAGATVPLVGPPARARLVALARRSGAPDATVGAALSLESTLDEISFVLGPALVGLASVLARPGNGQEGAATAPRPAGGPLPARRSRMPRCVDALRAASALQGAMSGACQAGITAFTRRLEEEDHAGLVYAAMGVMSAVAGLSTAALPARFGPRARRRVATAAAFVLSLPLPRTHTLTGLYLIVTVLGAAYAPHLVTVFGLTGRAVPPARLAEAMAYATSSIVAGQALAVAVCGRLADARGPGAADGVRGPWHPGGYTGRWSTVRLRSVSVSRSPARTLRPVPGGTGSVRAVSTTTCHCRPWSTGTTKSRGFGAALNISRKESSLMRSPRWPGSEMAWPLRNTVSAEARAESQSCWVISAPSGVNQAMSDSSSWVPSTGRPWKKRRRRKTGCRLRSRAIARRNSSSSPAGSPGSGQRTQDSSLSWQ